ncbi:tail fiber assembly protein [Methanolacinia paynteri]|uniref:tail fiber assembly protein n=1 Tax=Methanolacinia paynteri TaxID=230356 RepID=UPI00064E9B90|nr:tail fiber assembly protein [Methanolacinia paynteri]
MTRKAYSIKTDTDRNILSIVSSAGECIPTAEANCDYQQFLEADESVKTYEVAYEYTFEGRLSKVRANRNRKLKETDKYTLSDYPISEEERTAWLNYRQALRDFLATLTEENIDSFEWPTRPDDENE